MSVRVCVPGETGLRLEHLVLDVNGTLTDRGEPIGPALDTLAQVREHLALHLVSADTFGGADNLAAALGASYRSIQSGADKVRYVRDLGPANCVAIGNGRNDALMLEAAALGIAVIGPKGAHRSAVIAADITTPSIDNALRLLLDPTALTATLRA